jgi:hypothetical protein
MHCTATEEWKGRHIGRSLHRLWDMCQGMSFRTLDMARPNYVCTTCSEHFTRKYSAKRHNITVHHNNGGEIVPLVEYLVGRNSGKYQASQPSWYRRSSKETRIHNFGHATAAADSVRNALRTGGLQRQQQAEYQHQQQEQYHRQWQQEQLLSPSIPPPPTAIQDQPPQITQNHAFNNISSCNWQTVSTIWLA